MTDSNTQSESRKPLYVFGVTFMACFIGLLICWPIPRPAYHSQAVISYEDRNAQKQQRIEFLSRLKLAAQQVTSDANIQKVRKSIQGARTALNGVIGEKDPERLKKKIQIRISNGSKPSGCLVSLTVSGAGTNDEIEFVNCMANQLIENLRVRSTNDAIYGESNPIREQLQLSKKRTEVLQLIHSAQQQKQSLISQLTPEQIRHRRSVANPAWEIYRTRLIELAQASSPIQKAAIDFERHMIQKEVATETPNLELALTNLSTNPSANPKTGQSGIQLVSHNPNDLSSKTDEISAQIRLEQSTQQNLQNELDRMSNDHNNASESELVRLLRPAMKAKPHGSGVTKNQFFVVIVCSFGFAMLISMNSKFATTGSLFQSAEEVSRKLGVPVIGTISMESETKEANQPGNYIKRIVLACELLLIAFAIIMLALTVIHSEVAVSIKENPVVGFMEAIRMIKPW